MLASDNEGGPLTLLEAMTLGLIPVCGDIPCLVQEVVSSENGFRVPRNVPVAYAEIVARLHQDRPLLERLSAAARQAITTHFTVEAMAQRYVNFFTANVRTVTPNPSWPKRIEPKVMRGADSHWLSLPVLRPLRRLVKQFQR